MTLLTDQKLIEAFRERFDFDRRDRNELLALNAKLEATNRKLQESEALKGRFLSNIRNGINNPLAAIMGLSSQLMNGEAEGAQRPNLARMIYSEAFYLNFQLENIFLAAELESGESMPELARVNVVGIVNVILDQLHCLHSGKRVAIDKVAPESLFTVTDARKVHVAILNLLANAVEFSPEGGRVTIKLALAAGELRITVRDRGPGIAPADHEAVFDRFRQLEAGSTKGHRGQGLGLSVTRALVELLGGALLLESTPGEGCSFTVSIPERGAGTEDLAGGGNVFLFGDGELF